MIYKKNIKSKTIRCRNILKKDDKFFSYRDEEFVVLNLNFSRGKFFVICKM